MKTFEDLTECEKSLIGEDEVENYAKIALMQEGWSMPADPVLMTLKPAPECQTTPVYEVQCEGYGGSKMYFPTAEIAQKVIELGAIPLGYEYQNGYKFYHDPSKGFSIKTEQLYKHGDISGLMRVLKENEEAEKHNKKVMEEYNGSLKAINAIRDQIIGECASARRERFRLGELISTFKEFVRLAGGDEAIALNFLKKKNSNADIVKAYEWHPEEPTPCVVLNLNPEAAPPPEPTPEETPVEVGANGKDGLPF